MSFAGKEESRTLGTPIELYLFVFGAEPDAYAGYTDHEEDVVREESINGETVEVTYQAIPITRGNISISGGQDKSTMEITTSRSASLASRYLIHPPSAVTNLTIFAGHVGETEFVRVWGGRVLAVIRRGTSEVVFSCEPRAVSVRRPGLNRRYGPGCPHLLYGPECRADKEAATVVEEVVSISGTLVTVDSAWASDPQKPFYIGGTAEWVTAEGFTERRGITAVDGGEIKLDGYPTGLVPETMVTLIMGCDHDLETGCAAHNNRQNFGGQKWIPLENPIGLRNQFS